MGPCRQSVTTESDANAYANAYADTDTNADTDTDTDADTNTDTNADADTNTNADADTKPRAINWQPGKSGCQRRVYQVRTINEFRGSWYASNDFAWTG